MLFPIKVESFLQFTCGIVLEISILRRSLFSFTSISKSNLLSSNLIPLGDYCVAKRMLFLFSGLLDMLKVAYIKWFVGEFELCPVYVAPG